jgi:hypothetical protein
MMRATKEETPMRTTESHSVYEIDTFLSRDAEYRVLERTAQRVFAVVRVAPEEPLELLAECPYTYNRETVRARALLVAQTLRDEDTPSYRET